MRREGNMCFKEMQRVLFDFYMISEKNETNFSAKTTLNKFD